MIKKKQKKLFVTNTGKAFSLSRSKLDLFLECPRCFYLDRKLGIGRPPGFPLTLNMAVDALLKKEFDSYRAAGKPHPLMKKCGIDAVPLQHADLQVWRTNSKGASCLHKPSGMLVTGAVDDVWIKPDGTLIIADYKSTSTSKEITIDEGPKAIFKRQIEVYQWIFRKLGFKVDSAGYLVYANALKTPAAFDATLQFDMMIIKVDADDSWVEDAIIRAHDCLASGKIPDPSSPCNYCAYVEQVRKVLP